MFIPGLVSVTFRPLTKEKICEITKEAGLSAVEWGGDIHVPPMDEEAIEIARTHTANRGLSIASYGSYYRCLGTSEADTEEMHRVVDTASLLNTSHIRVWAGKLGSANADETRGITVESLRKFCAIAKEKSITVSPEFHARTLTDTPESAVRLIEEVGAENMGLYWQPNQNQDIAYNLAALRTVLPYLTNVHIFSWEGKDRYPLIHHESIWKRYLDIIRSESTTDHHLLMEFVCGDTVEQFQRDAEVLLRWAE